MWFMRTSEMGTDTVSQFLCSEQADRLDHVAFAMPPVGFNRVEPGTLGGQRTDDEAHALALLAHLSVVRLDPVAYFFADVPGAIIPDQQQGLFASLLYLVAAPGQLLCRDAADGSAIHETQPDLFW